MSAQPEALRLAEFLEMHWCNVDMPEAKAAAELRRLSIENDRLQARYEACRIAVHQWLDKTEWVQDTAKPEELGMHRADVMRQRLERITAQRDALLEALKSTGLFLHHCWCDVQMNDYSFEKLNQQMAVVDAAIKAVEEEA